MIGLPGLSVKSACLEGETLVLQVRHRYRHLTCPDCGRRGKGRYDQSTRRWRHWAIWGHEVELEGVIRRLWCADCRAVLTEEVPWARGRSSFTRPFEDLVAFLAQRLNRTAVAELTGISWVTVGSIAQRVVAEQLDDGRFEGLRRIGVDEINYGRQQRFLTIVVDHDGERVIWAAEGKSSATLAEFFRQLGPERTRELEVISVDFSAAYGKAIEEAAPQAQIVNDRFHVARLANAALDEVRRTQMRKLPIEERTTLKGTRWALLKRPGRLAATEERKLSWIARFNEPVYRAHLLKESFLDLFDEQSKAEAEARIDEWLAWAKRSRLQPFIRFAKTVKRHIDGIVAFIDQRLTNARVEGMNNKIRLLSHRAFGFHSPEPLIATIYLCCSGIILPHPQLI
jgi:transposase